MILSTTPTIEGHPATQYHGVVTGEAILGANIFRDLFAGIRDIVGGRAGSYETVLRDARQQALSELADEARKMGANAVVGIPRLRGSGAGRIDAYGFGFGNGGHRFLNIASGRLARVKTRPHS